ncbi:MAG: PIG-L family deacetylase [Gemmatimonadales bacterium]
MIESSPNLSDITMPLDLLAAVAHPDDAELLAGGTLAKAVDAGHRVGILDLTRGEMGSRGNAEIRAREAAAASLVLGVTARTNAGLPDGHLENNDAMRRVVVEQLRRLKPRDPDPSLPRRSASRPPDRLGTRPRRVLPLGAQELPGRRRTVEADQGGLRLCLPRGRRRSRASWSTPRRSSSGS